MAIRLGSHFCFSKSFVYTGDVIPVNFFCKKEVNTYYNQFNFIKNLFHIADRIL